MAQVAGFERSQLSTLFSGIMSHLLAHVGKELQQQQQQQQPGSTEGRRRRQPAKTAPASAPAAAAPGDPGSVDADAVRQQVAAALAAHVSARVPFNSTLAPHVLHILQDKVSAWPHAVCIVRMIWTPGVWQALLQVLLLQMCSSDMEPVL